MLTEKKHTNKFRFKQFTIKQDHCSMKVGTDGILLGAWADAEGAETVLDIGTGTGLIALMLAQRSNHALIHGVEIDAGAAAEAAENVMNSPWAERLTIKQIPIQDFSKTYRSNFDLIVCNPPFFTGGTLSNNQDRNDVRHTVKLPNGDLLSSCRALLSKSGKFCCILPLIEGLRLKQMAERYNLYCTKMTEVKSRKENKVERLLLQFELNQKPFIKDMLTIYEDGSDSYSKDYARLTGDFYLNL